MSLSHYSRTKIAAEKLLLASDKQRAGRDLLFAVEGLK
jgi:hypothetical protein